MPEAPITVAEVGERVALKRKITLLPDPGVERQRALVTISLTGGRSFAHRATAVHGTPDNPMSMDEVRHKAAGLMLPVLGEATTRELIDAICNVEEIGDVRGLRRLLRAAPAD
jgi:hypothetical protein